MGRRRVGVCRTESGTDRGDEALGPGRRRVDGRGETALEPGSQNCVRLRTILLISCRVRQGFQALQKALSGDTDVPANLTGVSGRGSRG